jgi:hypothetical protein
MTFVEKMKSELGFKAVHREVTEVTGTSTLREQSEGASSKNTLFWDEITGLPRLSVARPVQIPAPDNHETATWFGR